MASMRAAGDRLPVRGDLLRLRAQRRQRRAQLRAFALHRQPEPGVAEQDQQQQQRAAENQPFARRARVPEIGPVRLHAASPVT